MLHGRERTFILLESAYPLNGAEFGRVGPAEPNARRNSNTGGFRSGSVGATGGSVEVYLLLLERSRELIRLNDGTGSILSLGNLRKVVR